MQPDTFYHFFNRANNREDLFTEEDNYRCFLELLKKYIPPIAEVYSYCLLPNHFHLVIRIKELEELPEQIRVEKQVLKMHMDNYLITGVPFYMSESENDFRDAMDKTLNY